ncbi:hypothetical protein A2839_02590 [Candidatus Uhrbacteria bacterium RIFCSPHIGHO2_01_FULL_47_10]|nr:MAG: hypothetical protein A2839_02590 [Candidatus Uhrbacteria bacterium RIFCSPHIGHO2_01_FULL_47_10]
MKRLSFFGVAVAIIILSALGIWFATRPTPAPSTSTPAAISPAVPADAPATASLLVTPIVASVAIAPSTNPSTFQPITFPTQVISGARVKTDVTGRALVEGTNTTVLDSNSEMTIAVLDTQKNQTRLQLEAGQVWSRVKKLSDKGEFYEIETQLARASVRGTSFGMKKAGNVTTVYVVEGVVNFGSLPPEENIGFESIDVVAGKKAVLHDWDLKPVVSDITDKDRQDAWYVFNNPTKATAAELNVETSSQTFLNPPTNTSSTTETSVPPRTPTQATQSPTTPRSPTQTAQPSAAEPAQEPASSSQEVQPTTPNQTISPATPDSPELLLSSVSPSSLVARTGGTLTLKGAGFQDAQVFSVFIGNTRITSFTTIDNSTIRLTVKAFQFEPGEYDVTVAGASNATATISSALLIKSQP